LSPAIIGSALVQGFALILVATGFTVVYRATGVLNFATGEQLVLGGYAGYLLYDDAHVPFVVTVLLVIGIGAFAGAVIDRVVLGAMTRASVLTQVIVLLALSQALDAAYLEVFGPEPTNSVPYASTRAIVPGLDLSTLDLIVIGTSAVSLLALYLFLYTTSMGMWMRATASNRAGAGLVGINPRLISTVSWVIGGALTALAGCMILPKYVLTPTAGTTFTFSAFAAVTLGGFGSVIGAAVGSLLISLVDAVVGAELASGYEPLVALVTMLVVLALLPTGIIGERR
jgi:branched-chain amino acid transport system permease protein